MVLQACMVRHTKALRIDGTAPTSGEYYTIQPGDTLSGIAAKFGTTWQWLAEINSISDPDLIYPGNTIRVR